LYELSYALRHYLKQMSRQQVAEYLLMVVSWRGIQGEQAVVADAVERWRDTPGLAFVDAYLAARAVRDQRPVYTMNVSELHSEGAVVPRRLPARRAAR
jgi:hypothetical protein